MEVSKLTIRQSLLDNKLGKKHKVKLRTEGVKSYIRSKPAGYLFSYADLIYSAGYTEKQYGTGWAFIKRLIGKKTIAIADEQPGKRKQSFYIPGDIKPKETEKPGLTGTVVEQPVNYDKNIPTHQWIVDRAKKFVWDTNSDSLREFIATLQ